jgi:hypothetical protein
MPASTSATSACSASSRATKKSMSSSLGCTLPRAQAARPPASANRTSLSRRAAAAFLTVVSICSKVTPVEVMGR